MVAWVAKSDGAHASAMPVVPCAHDMIGHPPAGGAPPGTTMYPETPVSPPWTVVERYKTLHTLELAGIPGTPVTNWDG